MLSKNEYITRVFSNFEILNSSYESESIGKKLIWNFLDVNGRVNESSCTVNEREISRRSLITCQL